MLRRSCRNRYRYHHSSWEYQALKSRQDDTTVPAPFHRRHSVPDQEGKAVSVDDRAKENRHKVGIAEGDVIVVHYKTYDAETTYNELTVLVGEQNNKVQHIMQNSK